MAKGRPLILVIEEELALRRYLRRTLQSNGYRVAEAATSPEGLAMVGRFSPDLVILDLDMPSMDGLELDRDLRSTSQVPIIVLSDQDGEAHMVRALDQGADDFLAKPFGSAELLARIRVALRHSANEVVHVAGSLVEIGPLKMDCINREITLAGVEVHLTPNEFALLAILVKHVGKVVSHQQLLAAISGNKPPTQPGILLRVYLARLRKKLEPDPTKPHLLTTKLGRGYRLNAAGLDRPLKRDLK